ncbi:MAG: hypothetical protein PUG48_03460 [Clostridia bacterium]|nr:hypothetical protein [Clostridia bacterium]
MIDESEEFKELFEQLFNDLENYEPSEDEKWDDETQKNWDEKMDSYIP